MRNIGVNINTSKDVDGQILKEATENIYNTIRDVNIKTFRDAVGLNSIENRDLDFVISLGGDGTMLRTARELCTYGIPVLGVNIGHLGFLTEVGCSEFKAAIKSISEGKYFIEKRTMLESTIKSDKSLNSYAALNDIVISKGTLARMVKYDIEIDGKFYNSFTADGVIISTPTGSTAYSLSAGGPLIYPTLDLISITPICPHSLGVRTIVLDSKSKVNVKINKNYESVFLTLDGQKALELGEEDIVSVSKASCDCNLIRLEEYDYFKILRKKIISRTKECEGEKI